MLPKLKTNIFINKDISEQPDSTYILAIGGSDKRGYYAVDSVEQRDGRVEFYRARNGQYMLIYSCKLEAAWNLFHRDVLEQMTEEEYTRHALNDEKEAEELSKELRPELHAAMEKAKKQFMKEHGITDDSVVVETPTVSEKVPGHYL